jgi:hypothetical protein
LQCKKQTVNPTNPHELRPILLTLDGVAQEIDEADDGADADGSVPDAVVVEGAEHGLLLVDAVGEHHAVPFRGRVGCGLGGADGAQLQHLQHRPDRRRPGPLGHRLASAVRPPWNRSPPPSVEASDRRGDEAIWDGIVRISGGFGISYGRKPRKRTKGWRRTVS